MDSKRTAEVLASLVHLDVDAVKAYELAIAKINVGEINLALTGFKSDHERHIAELTSAIVRLGGTPPTHRPDFIGFSISGMTALRSASGTLGALKAMKTNEELTTQEYRQATSTQMPDEYLRLVWRNYQDEQKHLRYITLALEAVEHGGKAPDVSIHPGLGLQEGATP